MIHNKEHIGLNKTDGGKTSPFTFHYYFKFWMIIIILLLSSVFFVKKINKKQKLSILANDYIYISETTFTQYDSDPITGNAFDQFQHTISAFKIGKYEVTYQLWYEVLQWAEQNGYTIENPGKEGFSGKVGAPPQKEINEPVCHVNFFDVIVWCNAYSQKENMEPVYLTEYGDILKNSTAANHEQLYNSKAEWTRSGYRLPSEGEWKLAASDRGGRDISRVNQNMTYTIVSVILTEANELGVCGTSENVWEWCWDWYASLPEGPVSDYRGPESGGGKIMLGGRAYYDLFLIAGYRLGIHPETKSTFIGFRLAQSIPINRSE